jgi:hypothetical protein
LPSHFLCRLIVYRATVTSYNLQHAMRTWCTTHHLLVFTKRFTFAFF